MSLDRILPLVGGPAALSPWVSVSQSRIDGFAEVTEDRQFLHVDPVRAAQSVFGGTVAHGFLTLSLLSHLFETTAMGLPPVAEGVNYGLDRVRFLAPVPSGARIRGRFALTGAEPRDGGWTLLRIAAQIEIEASERPALAADWLALVRFGDSA